MATESIPNYVKERDKAFLSLNKQKIVRFCNKHGIPLPEDETVFWAGVHKAICHINSATAEQKLNSMIWLVEHGFHWEINVGYTTGVNWGRNTITDVPTGMPWKWCMGGERKDNG